MAWRPAAQVERVVHVRDLVYAALAAQPLHAISLGDALGECAVILLGDGKVWNGCALFQT